MSRFEKVFIYNNRWKLYLQGLGNSLLIAIVGFAISLGLGICFAMLLHYSEKTKKLKWLAIILKAIIDLIRAIPLLLQLLLGYFAVFIFIDSALIVAIIVFGINSSAYMAEIIRGGLDSVESTQYESALSLGLTPMQSIRKILLPQALKNALLSIGNELITVLKMTSLVGYISIVDLTQAANIISTNTFDYFLPLTIVAIIYVVLVTIITFIIKKIEKTLKMSD